MSPRRTPTDMAASVRARLRALARERGVEFQLVLSEFAIERMLFRLGVSVHAERFVLKGATLFKLWSPEDRRATWDLDLLGPWVPNGERSSKNSPRIMTEGGMPNIW